MTIAQKLEQKGFQRGLQEGLQEGRLEGRLEGYQEATLKIAHALLGSGVDRETVMKTTGLSQNGLEQIHSQFSLKVFIKRSCV